MTPIKNMRSSTADRVPPCGTQRHLPSKGGFAALLSALRSVVVPVCAAAGLMGLPAAFAGEQGALIEVAYSPNEGAEQLVLKVVDDAKKSIRVAAYSFTLPSFVRALVNAKKRGVDVRIAVDYKMNTEEDRYKTARSAMNLVVNAGIPLRTVSAWPIHHDKFIVVDDKTVETGSFNFSTSATKSRENVLAIWNNPALAATYSTHWQESWNKGIDYTSTY